MASFYSPSACSDRDSKYFRYRIFCKGESDRDVKIAKYLFCDSMNGSCERYCYGKTYFIHVMASKTQIRLFRVRLWLRLRLASGSIS